MALPGLVSAPAHADDAAAGQSSLARAAAYAEPSTVYLRTSFTGYVYDKLLKKSDGSSGDYIRDRKGEAKKFTAMFTCTGFIVSDDGYVATAGHCLQIDDQVLDALKHDAAQYFIKQGNDYAEKQLVDDYAVFHTVDDAGTVQHGPTTAVDVLVPSNADGMAAEAHTTPAQVVAQQAFDDGDAALVKIAGTGLNALPISTTPLAVGDPVVAVGYPASVEEATDASLQPSFEPGQVNSVKTVGDGTQRVYQVDAEMGPGMSGGPALTADGKVTGFTSFASTGSTAAFNFIRPAATINGLLESAGAENRLTATSQQYRDGIDALYAGDRGAAVEALTAVVKAQPHNQVAADQLARAQRLPIPGARAASVEHSSGHPVALAALGVLLVVLLAGGAVVGALALRSRGRAPRAYSTTTGRTPVAGRAVAAPVAVRRYPTIPPPPYPPPRAR